MNRINILLPALVFLSLITSCAKKLDNYDPPNGGVFGKIVDAETNQPVPLPFQGANGVIVRMMEQGTGATKSVDFYAKQDGTFLNAMMFNGKYSVSVGGPFVAPGEATTTVNGQTEVTIPVIPYARIEASASVSGKVITIQYEVQTTDPSYTTSEVYGYWNIAPGVDNAGANFSGKQTVNATAGTITFDLSNQQAFSNNLYKIQANGNKIYVRIGAKTQGAINYSPVYVLTVS